MAGHTNSCLGGFRRLSHCYPCSGHSTVSATCQPQVVFTCATYLAIYYSLLRNLVLSINAPVVQPEARNGVALRVFLVAVLVALQHAVAVEGGWQSLGYMGQILRRV